MKNEERKKLLDKDKINKILNKIRKQSKNEVYSLLNDISYKKIIKILMKNPF